MYLDCDCYAEGIGLEYDEEDEELSMAFFHFGHGGTKRTIKDRLRLAWHILITGYPYADMVIFGPSKAKSIASFINSRIK